MKEESRLLKAFMQPVTWEQIAPKMGKICPVLADIINTISPDPSFSLYSVRYPFGGLIIDRGIPQFPNEAGMIVPISDLSIPESIRKDLSYLSVPFGVVMDASIEVYRELPERVFSVAFTPPGTGIQLGIWEYLGQTAGFSVSAGARSLYMLPSISDDNFHRRISKKFNCSPLAPRSPVEHWQTFKEISNSPNFPDPWSCEMLFFGKKWHEHLNDRSSSWQGLKMHILEKSWEHSSIGRSRYIIDIDWHVMVETLVQTKQKVNPYILDTLRHLISISVATLPASKPAINDQAGPISALQKIWSEDYRLKNYTPTIMQPCYYDHARRTPVYYSFCIPTLLASAPNFNNVATNIDDMRELILLIQVMRQKHFTNIRIAGIALDEILKTTEFTFFHEPRYAYGDIIRPSTEMPIEDPDLIFTQNNLSGMMFAANGQFCRGCIRIHTTKT